MGKNISLSGKPRGKRASTGKSSLRPTEHSQQRLLFEWAKLHEKKYPELKLMFAIPNGGDRHPIVGKKLKAEGVKAGVPDIFLPVPSTEGYFVRHGLFIEMKRDDKEKLKPKQCEWAEALKNNGFCVEVGYGFEDARDKIIAYLSA